MGRQLSQIEEVNRNIKTIENQLQNLLAKFGISLLSQGFFLEEQHNLALYETLIESKNELDELSSYLAHLQKVGKSMEEAHQNIKDLKKRIAQQEGEIKVVFQRVGVIAWEESSSNVLPKEISELIPTIKERQDRILLLKDDLDNFSKKSSKKSPFVHISSKAKSLVTGYKLKQYSKSNEKFFTEIGSSIADWGFIKKLNSLSAASLDELYRNLKREKEHWTEEVSLLSNEITHKKKELENEGVGSSIGRRIQELKHEYKEKQVALDKLAVKYALLVCENEKQWNIGQLDDDSKSFYEQVNRQNKIKVELLKSRKELLIESEIGELIFLIEQDEERIKHIQNTIDQYNRQIEEVKETITKNREKIGKLKRSLTLSLEQKD
ncbi:MAG: hypothetical protein WDA17_01740 [Sphaerochaetaceae bacterium]